MPQRSKSEVPLHSPTRTCVTSARMPPHERVLDRLADLLFDSDEILGMLESEDTVKMRWIAPRLQAVYEEVNALMMELVD